MVTRPSFCSLLPNAGSSPWTCWSWPAALCLTIPRGLQASPAWGVYYYQYGRGLQWFQWCWWGESTAVGHSVLPAKAAHGHCGDGLQRSLSWPSAASSSPWAFCGAVALPRCWWLAVLHMLIAGAYVPALYFYFHNLRCLRSPLCKEGGTVPEQRIQWLQLQFPWGRHWCWNLCCPGHWGLCSGSRAGHQGLPKVRKLKEKPAEMLEF